MQNRFHSLLLCLVVSGLACHEQPLIGASEVVVAEPSEVDFGAAPIGATASATVSFEGRGEVTLDLEAPFSADPASFSAPAASVFTFHPTAIGAESIGVVLPGGAPLRLRGLGITTCESTNACVTSSWSASDGRCVERPKTDGESCEQACLEAGRCLGGQCVGRATSCDDSNACTTDSCDSRLGCTHATIACAASSNPCLAPRCEPSTGCALEPVIDGTSCGPRDCSTANVCIAGACVTRAVPDGAPCGAASTCQASGVCQGGSCARPAPTRLQLAWRRPMSSFPGLLFPGLKDASGNLYWVEEYRRLVSVTPAGALRYSVFVNTSVNQADAPNDTIILAGDLVILSYHQDRYVEAHRQSDGSFVWRHDFSTVNDWQRLTDLVSDGADLFVVGFYSPISRQTPGVTVISCLELATGALRWERSTGLRSEVPTSMAFSPPTLALDSLGPIVGTSYGEHQSTAQGWFQMIAYTKQGDVRWARSSIERLAVSIGDRSFFRSPFTLGWVTPDGGVHLIPSAVPSALDRPVALLTDAGVVVGGLDPAKNLIFQAERTSWRLLASFSPLVYYPQPVTPPLVAANGLVSFLAFERNATNTQHPALFELNPTTGELTKCEFDLDPLTAFDLLTPTVELPGLIVVADRLGRNVWAFHR